MTVIILSVAVVIQAVVILCLSVSHRCERDKLLDRIMSRDLIEYRQSIDTPSNLPRRSPYTKVKEAWRSPSGKDET